MTRWAVILAGGVGSRFWPLSTAERPKQLLPLVADELGNAGGRGDAVTVILEHPKGIAIVSVLAAEAVLLVLVQPSANIGQLLYELRRNREHIAALV